MSLHVDKPHPLDGHQNIDAEWFDSKREHYSKSSKNEALAGIVREEIDALQALYDNSASPADSAYSITRPVSTSQLTVPVLGTDLDESIALTPLCHILRDALVQWPPSRKSDLLALLNAIRQLPQTIRMYGGGDYESQDIEVGTGVRPITWGCFNLFFDEVWNDSLRKPGVIVRQASQGTPELSQSEYIRRKAIEAQLIACGVLPFGVGAVGYVAKTLERQPDKAVPADDAAAHEQNRLEFQVPAVASLMAYCGAQFFDWVVRWDREPQRWTRWEERLAEIADKGSDAQTRTAARVAYIGMQVIGLEEHFHSRYVVD